ncbi:MAG: endonuclease III [Candidatus Hadarchaeota archaeon]
MASNYSTNRAIASVDIRLGTETRRMGKILDILGKEFKPWKRQRKPYEVMVWTVLSQHTNDRNTTVASAALLKRFKSWQGLAKGDISEIKKLVRPAGLQKAKAKHLKEISNAVLYKYGGDLRKVLKMPAERARKELLSLPGVGYKTADVVLAFAAGRDVIAVDTHVFRVSKRLGFAFAGDNHEEVKARLERATPQGRKVEAHTLLIQLGRKYCRALAPLHEKCPVRNLCPMWNKKLIIPRVQQHSTT